ncbi:MULTISPECIES: PaaI family thioesterase [Vibrio]|uniref:Acyl-coenzyme A thioesterase THEM4 n=2 Tax=Vibrio TaxID=662 RepID=A0A7X4RUJ0_9VIBR|nr:MULTISPECIES: PaaI family thioesterase [Vibrio]MBF9002650.1 PaaI family thioesterase [Vibrio nitrifigilis]MZI93921.1 PaaI family thioesterase [Vibrio eleionomae]
MAAVVNINTAINSIEKPNECRDVLELNLPFTQTAPLAVKSQYIIEEQFQGYKGILHGGIAATLLDTAMVSCLNQAGIMAMTVELTMRYHSTIHISDLVIIEASVEKERHRILHMTASLLVNDQCCVSAKAKFMRTG